MRGETTGCATLTSQVMFDGPAFQNISKHFVKESRGHPKFLYIAGLAFDTTLKHDHGPFGSRNLALLPRCHINADSTVLQDCITCCTCVSKRFQKEQNFRAARLQPDLKTR